MELVAKDMRKIPKPNVNSINTININTKYGKSKNKI